MCSQSSSMLLSTSQCLLQKVAAVFLSLVYGSLNGHTSFGAFAMMRDIAASNEVVSTSSLGMGLRCASAAGLTLGSLLFGARIVPVTGRPTSLPLSLPCYVMLPFLFSSAICACSCLSLVCLCWCYACWCSVCILPSPCRTTYCGLWSKGL